MMVTMIQNLLSCDVQTSTKWWNMGKTIHTSDRGSLLKGGYLWMVLCLLCSDARGALIPSIVPLNDGFANISMVTKATSETYNIPKNQESGLITKLCGALNGVFKRFSWDQNPCGVLSWQAEYRSLQGYPLIFLELGKGTNTTLFLGGVHPDELTPVPMVFRLARYLAENPALYADKHVIIAPLVNPDGFFAPKLERTNRRVDINRNFLTLDWYDGALEAWRKRHSAQKRYFPGFFPNSEIETLFQIHLIENFQPNKILSVHAPLGFFDYDGPGDQKPRYLRPPPKSTKAFVEAVAEKSRNYKVVDYSFFPGSLGNYTGNERDVPTITLELQASMPKMVEAYWNQFLPGFVESIRFGVDL